MIELSCGGNKTGGQEALALNQCCGDRLLEALLPQSHNSVHISPRLALGKGESRESILLFWGGGGGGGSCGVK